MDRKSLIIDLVIFTVLISSCGILKDEKDEPSQIGDTSQEQSEIFTDELMSKGFEFCPDAYIDVSIDQIHEFAQFNFFNHVSSNGQLRLEMYGTGKKSGLRTEGEIPLSGEGWVGACFFKSSGSFSFNLIARLIPGEGGYPNLLIQGQCDNFITTKPLCGDFGMIPVEKKIHIVLPYRDGESFELKWENRSTGVSGSSVWILHIPCE